MGRNKKGGKKKELAGAPHSSSDEDSGPEGESGVAAILKALGRGGDDVSSSDAEGVAPTAPTAKKAVKIAPAPKGKGGKHHKEGKEPKEESSSKGAGKDGVQVEVPAAAAPAARAKGEDSSDDEGVHAAPTMAPRFPLKVAYCPNCGFPDGEYCEFSGVFEKCKPWLKEHLAAEEAATLDAATDKGRKRRDKQDPLEKLEKVILVQIKKRSGRKVDTAIQGLDAFGCHLKEVMSELKKIYSCGVSVIEVNGFPDAVVVQGDVTETLVETLGKKYGVPADAFFYIGKGGARVPMQQ